MLECDFNVSLELIAKPTSDFIIRLYTHFLETFMGIDNLYERARELAMRRLEVLKNGDDNASDEGAEQNGGSNLEENSIEPSATDEILTLFRCCRKFFQNIGVDDFTLLDLTRPEALSTKRLLSIIYGFEKTSPPSMRHWLKKLTLQQLEFNNYRRRMRLVFHRYTSCRGD